MRLQFASYKSIPVLKRLQRYSEIQNGKEYMLTHMHTLSDNSMAEESL
jgi:hypothetical protein